MAARSCFSAFTSARSPMLETSPDAGEIEDRMLRGGISRSTKSRTP